MARLRGQKMFRKGRRIRGVIMNVEKCAKLRIFDADFVTGLIYSRPVFTCIFIVFCSVVSLFPVQHSTSISNCSSNLYNFSTVLLRKRLVSSNYFYPTKRMIVFDPLTTMKCEWFKIASNLSVGDYKNPNEFKQKIKKIKTRKSIKIQTNSKKLKNQKKIKNVKK